MNGERSSPGLYTTTGYTPRQITCEAQSGDAFGMPQPAGGGRDAIRQRRSIVVRRIADVTDVGKIHAAGECDRKGNVGSVHMATAPLSGGSIRRILPPPSKTNDGEECHCVCDCEAGCTLDKTPICKDVESHAQYRENSHGHVHHGTTETGGKVGHQASKTLIKGGNGPNHSIEDEMEGKGGLSLGMDYSQSMVRDRCPHPRELYTPGRRVFGSGLGRRTQNGKSRSPSGHTVCAHTREGCVPLDTAVVNTKGEGTVDKFDHLSGGENIGSVSGFGTLHKEGSLAPRCGVGGSAGAGPTCGSAISEACGSFRLTPEYGKVSGAVHDPLDQGIDFGESDVETTFLRSVALEPWFQAEERKTKGTMATITRRAHKTRLATIEEEKRIPLQQVTVPVLDLSWILDRLNPNTRERFQLIWSLVGRKPSRGTHESERRIPSADADILREAGVISSASSTEVGAWCVPFSVVEEKTSGTRRRWIAWPREKNEEDPYEAQMPLGHISQYLDAVLAEGASCLDLRASFFQVALPLETRHLFRCRAEMGDVVELTRLPMGYKVSPEILQIVTSAIAGEPNMVLPLLAAPHTVRVDVWIDNMRFTGNLEEVMAWDDKVQKDIKACGATIGDRDSGVQDYTFLGVHFHHATHSVTLSDKCVRSLKGPPMLEDMTVAELEVITSRFLYAAAILGVRLTNYFFFLKAVRRRLSALNRGILKEGSKARLPPSALALGSDLRKNLLRNEKRTILPSKEATAALITDASLQGWGAVYLPDSGEVKVAGGEWQSVPLLIMQAEARPVRLALRAFEARLPKSLEIWIDNTSLQGAATKGSAKSWALTWELKEIYDFLDTRKIRATFAYMASKENPADGLSRGALFTVDDLAKGLNLRRGAVGSCGWRTFRTATW